MQVDLKDIRPRVCNSPLIDDSRYAARQCRLFADGKFALMPVSDVTDGDQVFLDLGRGAGAVVSETRPTALKVGTATVLVYRPDPESPQPVPAEEQFANDARVFVRRPSLDPKGAGLRDVVLELPADMGPDGAPIPAPARVTGRALLVILAERARRMRPALPAKA